MAKTVHLICGWCNDRKEERDRWHYIQNPLTAGENREAEKGSTCTTTNNQSILESHKYKP